MNEPKMKERLENELAGIVDAVGLANEQLSEGQLHVRKLETCLIQLRSKQEVYEKLLSEIDFAEKPEKANA